MKNKSVLFITGSLSDGGAEKVMSILASGCADIGANVTLVILRNKKNIYPVSKSVNIIQLSCEGRLCIIKRLIELHKIIKDSNAQVIIPFLPIISLYTLIANIGIGKKIIMSERADPNVKIRNLNYKDFIGSFIMRRMKLYSLANWVVFQTLDAQSYYGKKIKKKSSIILNPLDLKLLPERYLGEREKIVVAIGRFSHEKNFQLLINGFKEFHKDFPTYKLIIYGDGELRNKYEQMIREYNLEDFIQLPGFIADIHQQINKASMYISTSNHEGISNSMLEALGMGIPTIVTDCPVGGARMFVKSNENGILIPMNDCRALVDAMKRIASNEDYSNKLSLNAVKVRKQLSSEVICKKWLELI